LTAIDDPCALAHIAAMSSIPPSGSAPKSSATAAKRCGAHVELSSTPGAKVTRCPCGTVHVHLARNGLSLRMKDEDLRHVANALAAAARVVDRAETPVSLPSGGGRDDGPLN
jgi:hypothetical protein